MKRFSHLRFLSRFSGRLGSPTDRLHVTESLGHPELLHGEGMHQREMSLDHLMTSVRMLLCYAVVLLQVHGVLSHPQWICHVGTNKFKAFNTLATGVGSGLLGIGQELRSYMADTSSFTDVDGSVIEIVVRDHEQHFHIGNSQIRLTLLQMALIQGRTIFCLQEPLNC